MKKAMIIVFLLFCTITLTACVPTFKIVRLQDIQFAAFQKYKIVEWYTDDNQIKSLDF